MDKVITMNGHFPQQMRLFITMALQGLLLVQFHQQFVTQLMY